MNMRSRYLLILISLAVCATLAHCSAAKKGVTNPTQAHQPLPEKDFTHPPAKPHDPADLVFTFDQLDHYYRVPGEYTHRLTGDQYGFDALSFIITETHPGGGPGLHVHDTEEAHVLLEGTVQYRVGDKTFTVQGPYVAKVPAGVPHTFVNAGSTPFNLIAVFASKHPNTKRIGPNPLVPADQHNREEPRSGAIP
jgi:mannose-6-phosphate isomerase-like protein (cupin superfamily)